MKEQKPLRQVPVEENMPPLSPQDASGPRDRERGPQSGTVQHLPVKPAQNMQNEMRTRRTRSGGRLSRETLDKLGKVLDGLYADVRNQGVPDKFKDLLRQFDESKDKGSN